MIHSSVTINYFIFLFIISYFSSILLQQPKIISDIIIFISTEVIKMNLADFCCGMLAGWSYTLVGQPLDYLKTVMQMTTKNPSEINIMKDIYKKHGFKGFYRGSSSMFLGFSLVGGMEFCVYEWVKRQIYHRTGNRKG